MADPVKVLTPKAQWTKIATAITVGQVYLHELTPDYYLIDYRATGEAAPSDFETAVKPEGIRTEIINGFPIDVYFYCNEIGGEVIVCL